MCPHAAPPGNRPQADKAAAQEPGLTMPNPEDDSVLYYAMIVPFLRAPIYGMIWFVGYYHLVILIPNGNYPGIKLRYELFSIVAATNVCRFDYAYLL